MAASAGVRKQGTGFQRRAPRSPLGGPLALIAPALFMTMDNGRSHAACGSGSLAPVSRGRLQGGFTSAAPSQS
jgi:hypothetical protein